MRLTNRTHSPYGVPTAEGEVIVSAFATVEIEPTAEFMATIAREFWGVDGPDSEVAEIAAPEPARVAQAPRKRGRPRKNGGAK